MGKQGYEPAPTAPLPTAPPPPYDAQPPYNPYGDATQAPPYQYQPTPVIHETPQQAGQSLYPSVPQYPQPVQVTGGNTVVVGVTPLLVGRQPLRTTCPNCNSTIKTMTVKKSKTLAHLICLGLCFVGCCLCSCIPYCMDSMSLVVHTCPKCKAHLGTYEP
ncbi:lipopolysaccharide-induced tumor necrosis factor-alpha factor homolog [Macrosteles quadrilineatus]|uniref:lipopolysaccharide-induced tumor necrosis factor-alpha factor homolog n=1 Tax=Macrosteles quadrilineatus TaxID=74068 RepID=UPI0023E0B9A3|nr:lipopolysaccharide-induced tumor necrosis factor-alpha factor homolog [Macrosteles quadrilineatus]